MSAPLNQQLVNQLYREYLGRDAEAGVAEQWMNVAGNTDNLRAALADSAEYKQRFDMVRSMERQQPTVEQQVQQNRINPQLTPQTTAQATLIQDRPYNLLQPAPQVNVGGTQAAATNVNTQAGQVQMPGTPAPTSTQVQGPTQAQGQTYDPTTVMDRYSAMMQNFNPDAPPAWAAGAVRTATQQMNQRGVAASTMAGEATTMAIMEAAKPIAMADAQIMNAAKQFNATSLQQATQFYQNMQTDIAKNNATRTDAMAQFNRNLEQQVAALNANNAKELEITRANLANSVEQFNAAMRDSREKFNLNNQLAIEQSNVNWRRMINTSNTAAINAANQVNVQNQFNMSQWALAAQWQQARDEAAWAQESAQNAENRAHNMALAALQRDMNLTMLSAEQRNGIYQSLGTWAAGVISGLMK